MKYESYTCIIIIIENKLCSWLYITTCATFNMTMYITLMISYSAFNNINNKKWKKKWMNKKYINHWVFSVNYKHIHVWIVSLNWFFETRTIFYNTFQFERELFFRLVLGVNMTQMTVHVLTSWLIYIQCMCMQMKFHSGFSKKTMYDISSRKTSARK